MYITWFGGFVLKCILFVLIFFITFWCRCFFGSNQEHGLWLYCFWTLCMCSSLTIWQKGWIIYSSIVQRYGTRIGLGTLNCFNFAPTFYLVFNEILASLFWCNGSVLYANKSVTLVLFLSYSICWHVQIGWYNTKN